MHLEGQFLSVHLAPAVPGGFGLGLSIARRFTEVHGGTTAVDTEKRERAPASRFDCQYKRTKGTFSWKALGTHYVADSVWSMAVESLSLVKGLRTDPSNPLSSRSSRAPGMA